MQQRIQHQGMPAAPTEVSKRLELVGWGVFFVWVGIAVLAGISFGIGLLGVAIITLGMQLVRRAGGLKMEGLWLAAGFVFLAGAIWEVLNVGMELVPILLIVAGVALLVTAFSRKRRPEVPRQ